MWMMWGEWPICLKRTMIMLDGISRRIPKEKKSPHFLGQLSQELRDTHLNTLMELSTLNSYLEQLEFLLTAGQTPERVGGFKDTVHFEAVMDEAVISHQRELDQMGIVVVRNYHAVGAGIAEIAKLRLIVVNLIRNAMNAMRDVTEQALRLVLHVLPCPDRDRFVRLQVEDTGCGISSDSLTRVFSPQGAEAHSDLLPNLHTSALAAKDLGGSLRVWSDGPESGSHIYAGSTSYSYGGNTVMDMRTREPQDLSD